MRDTAGSAGDGAMPNTSRLHRYVTVTALSTSSPDLRPFRKSVVDEQANIGSLNGIAVQEHLLCVDAADLNSADEQYGTHDGETLDRGRRNKLLVEKEMEVVA